MRRIILAVLLTPLLALVGSSTALASSGPKCNNSDQYGASCIDLTGDGAVLKDVQTYFVPPNRDYLSNRKWAFRLTRYTCDPRGQLMSQCHFDHQWRTAVRKGNPPQDGSTCSGLDLDGATYQDCIDYGVAYADARLRDFNGFYALPHTFRKPVYFCSDVVVKIHKHWVPNGAANTPGNRGCAEVHE
jgi:hypothetical protein